MAEEYKIKLTTDASEVNKEIKETSKDIKDASDEQGIFAKQTAVLSGAFKKLKGGVRSVITTFKTLKGAIAATGIGLLVIAFGSLVAFFTKTQKGVDLLDQAMAGLGAAVDVVVDRISKFGSSIMKFFSGDFSGALEGITETFSGLGDELIRETKAAASLEKTLQGLLDLERDFSVQKAKNNVIIREAEAAALNENIAASERLEQLQLAMDLTIQQAEEEERLALIKFNSISEQVALGESLREDLDKQAAAEIDLINIRAEKARTEKRLITQLQSLKNQIEAEENKRIADAKKEEERLAKEAEKTKLETEKTKLEKEKLEADAEKKAQSEADKLLKIQQNNSLLEIQDVRMKADMKLQIEQETALASIQGMDNEGAMKMAILDKYRIIQANSDKMFDDASLENKKKQNIDEAKLAEANTMNTLSAASQLAGALSSLAGDNKELAVASAIIDTYVGANKAFAQGGALGFISAAAVIAGGLANVRNIMQTEVKGSGGGSGGGSISIPSVPPLAQSLGQAVPQNGNINDLVNQGNSNEPIQAYVISQDVTDSQEAQSYIKNQTTL